MRFLLAFTAYRLLLPVLFLTAFPGWVIKMVKRGGFGTRLGERAAIYTTPAGEEFCGAVHIHAISVGETLIALKLMREWRLADPSRKFVLAVGTATGHAVATEAGLADVRVTYSPLDFASMVRRYLNRFEPAQIVLIEGEVWPNLLRICQRRNIPVRLVNARLSPRSARRYLKFRQWLSPMFSKLQGAAVQEAADVDIWSQLGVAREKIHLTGSIKFDPGSGPRPERRDDFQQQLDTFGKGRPVILLASTHIGEEAWIAEAIRLANPEALALIVPRHAERRAEVKADLERAGFQPVLRSAFSPPADPAIACFVADTTGELRDWTAHADAVIIGKSFLSTGGQNPGEAILARKPLICGPHMENFEPLISRLIAAGGCISTDGRPALASAVTRALDPADATALTTAASAVLETHQGATSRVVTLLRAGDF